MISRELAHGFLEDPELLNEFVNELIDRAKVSVIEIAEEWISRKSEGGVSHEYRDAKHLVEHLREKLIRNYKGNKMENVETNGGTDCCIKGACTEEGKVYSRNEYIGNLTPEQQERCNMVRVYVNTLQEVIEKLPAKGTRSFSDRCISEALTCLETCCMFAIKSIAFEGKSVK